MQFKTISATDPSYVGLKDQLAKLNDRFDYDALANAYNGLTVGQIVSFEYKEGKASIVAKHLEKRGLTRGVDLEVESAVDPTTKKNVVFITRLTDKKTQALVRAPKAPKPTPGATGPAATNKPAAK